MKIKVKVIVISNKYITIKYQCSIITEMDKIVPGLFVIKSITLIIECIIFFTIIILI